MTPFHPHRTRLPCLLLLLAGACSGSSPTEPVAIGFRASIVPGTVHLTSYGDPVPGAPTRWSYRFTIRVQAPADRGGTLLRYKLTLYDTASEGVLTTRTVEGPFAPTGPRPGRPLGSPGGVLEIDHDGRGDGPYLSGAPVRVELWAEVRDNRGARQDALAEAQLEALPPPAPRWPLGVTVRQNDPASGCAFDPVHGYGLVLDLDWEPVEPPSLVRDYTVAVFDGQGRPLGSEHASAPPLRLVRCDDHVADDARRGATWSVRATGFAAGSSSTSWAAFDFASCHEAGVPACR